MAALIYSLCALTSLACALLLLRGWMQTRHRLLLWSMLCFAGLTINNILLVVDKIVFPTEIDLSTWRLMAALLAPLLLLYGLIVEDES